MVCAVHSTTFLALPTAAAAAAAIPWNSQTRSLYVCRQLVKHALDCSRSCCRVLSMCWSASPSLGSSLMEDTHRIPVQKKFLSILKMSLYQCSSGITWNALTAFSVDSQQIFSINCDVDLNTVLRDSLVRNVEFPLPPAPREAVFLCGTMT